MEDDILSNNVHFGLQTIHMYSLYIGKFQFDVIDKHLGKILY